MCIATCSNEAVAPFSYIIIHCWHRPRNLGILDNWSHHLQPAIAAGGIHGDTAVTRTETVTTISPLLELQAPASHLDLMFHDSAAERGHLLQLSSVDVQCFTIPTVNSRYQELPSHEINGTGLKFIYT